MSPAGKAENVGNRVRDLRIEQGLTQEELGQVVGLTRQSIIAIERGRFTPSIHTVLMLARALKTSVDNLFWLTGSDEEIGEIA
ncbi:MAG TPA: helix-turn-helix transcriptional regulator [Anaerolineae bacterium]|nr:helix-turn-helix transcriptional regulator [Anaerolineae bacterium]